MDLPASFRALWLLGERKVELRDEPLEPPGPGELLVRIEAATTCGTDLKVYLRGGHPRMILPPDRFGHEMAGRVAACGEGVEGFSVGDRVVVSNSAPCGACRYCAAGRENLCLDLQYLNGAFAQFLIAPPRFVERATHLIPERLPARLAALAEPLACVLHGLEACEPEPGSDTLVVGAGPIGLLFVAALAAEGHRVVAADPHPGRLRTAARLGAAAQVQIRKQRADAMALRAAADDRLGFDLAVDATGTVEGWSRVVESLRPGGTANLFGGCPPGTRLPLDTERLHYSELTVMGVYHHRPSTVARALELLARESFEAGLLISAERPLAEGEEALQSMLRREALKVALLPWD